MTDYKSLYYGLFNGITDVVKAMEDTALTEQDEQLRNHLKTYILALRQIQLDAEEGYINQPKRNILITSNPSSIIKKS